MIINKINKTPAYLHQSRPLLLILSTLLWLSNATAHEIITRVSVNANDIGGNHSSKSPAISGDGRYIAFQSDATNLVSNDNNDFTDIFVYDRQTRQIRRISINSNGTEGNFVSFFPAISSDGHYITYQSDATNLVENDNNRTTDIFVHELKTGITQLISVDSNGQPGNSTSSEPTISANGQHIAFYSNATNLVKKDTNRNLDVFVHDRETGETARVSISSESLQANGTSFGAAISAKGDSIAFSSNATNLIKNDNNETTDIFIHNRQTGETTLVSLSSDGQLGNDSSFNASLSADGRYVAFSSRATNLVDDDTNEAEDIFLHDRQTHETVRVSINSRGQQADGRSFGSRLSTDGRYIAFNSDANNLVADDYNNSTDVFIHDYQTKQTQRLTLASQSDTYTPASSYAPAITNDGRWVTFESKAWNLVANDLNEVSDIFIYDRAYYASYEIATGVLYIPILTVQPENQLYRAKLQAVPDSTHTRFILEKTSAFFIPLENVPTSYTTDTGILHLPGVDIINPPTEIQQFEVKMTTNSEMTEFTRIELNPIEGAIWKEPKP